MILTNRALLPIFILTITLIGFNQKAAKAHSRSEIPVGTDSPNRRLEIEEGRLVIESIQVEAFKQGSNLQSLYLSEVPDSERSLLRALEVANSLEGPYLQATLLNDIAIQYSNLGKSDRAREILDQSLAVAKTIEDIVNQVTIMGAILSDPFLFAILQLHRTGKNYIARIRSRLGQTNQQDSCNPNYCGSIGYYFSLSTSL